MGRIPLARWLIVAVVVLVTARDAPAQWTWNKTRARGMFGDRELGETLKPRPSSRFNSGFLRGPSGNFLGRNADLRGARFPSLYPGAAPPYQAVAPPGVPGEIPPYLPEEPPAARFREAPEFEEAPQIWFRGSSPPGQARSSRSRSPMALPTEPRIPPAARPGIALGGAAGAGISESSPRPDAPGLATELAVGFPSPGPLDQSLSAALSSQISRFPRYRSGESVRVTVSGGTATLRGAVPTEHDRRVLAEFVRMEPGVSQVDNRLIVRPPQAGSD